MLLSSEPVGLRKAADAASLGLVPPDHPALHTKATELVCPSDLETRLVVDQMQRLMQSGKHGVGLAAPQVGLSWRLFITIAFDGANYPAEHGMFVFIAPENIEMRGPLVPSTEGCLSLPGVSVVVPRRPFVQFDAIALDGKLRRVEAGGIFARCVQHELDHLDGVMITKYQKQNG